MNLFTNKIYLVYITYFILLTFFSLMVNALFLRFFKTLGIRSNTGETIIRWGTLSKPAIGGITFYIMFLLQIQLNDSKQYITYFILDEITRAL